MNPIKLSFTLIVICAAFISCHPARANLNYREIELNILDFGAIANDGNDDAGAFDEIFKLISKRPENYVIRIPTGIFEVNKQLNANNLEGRISLKGSKGTVINVNGTGFGVFQSRSINIHLSNNVNRDDEFVVFTSKQDKEVSVNDLIHIESNTAYETAWKYKEHDIHRIRKKIKNKIQFNSSLLFNYNLNSELVKATVYKDCHLSFSDIEFILTPEKANAKNVARQTILTIWGVSLDMNNIGFNYKGDEEYYHVGLSVLASENLKFSNIKMRGFSYGILFNYCRNIEGKNTIAEFCRHAYTPAQATVNMKVENLRGENCHSVMDAHQAFNVHYKNVVDTLANQFPNCRSLGTTIENAEIFISKHAYQDYAYWSVQSLSKEYEYIYKEYETRFYNVNYVVPRPSSLNGLSSYTCRNLIVENCTTSSVAYYGDQNILEKVSIKNSRIGVIRIDGQKTEVDNTVLDGNLYPGAGYVLRFMGSGVTRLNKITIKNFNASRTYLFDHFYNQPVNNRIIISNSNIGKLKGFTNKLIYPGKRYENIEFEGTRIEEFEEQAQVEFPKVHEHMKSQKKQ